MKLSGKNVRLGRASRLPPMRFLSEDCLARKLRIQITGTVELNQSAVTLARTIAEAIGRLGRIAKLQMADHNRRERSLMLLCGMLCLIAPPTVLS